MKPGTILEASFWLDGRETPEHIGQFKSDMREAISEIQEQQSIVITPVTFIEKHIGDPMVPGVPDHIQGPDVRLLVAEAKVICDAPRLILGGSFLHDLDEIDLRRLRAITRKATPHRLSDAECDEIIEEIGPESALATIRDGVDSKAIH